MNLEKRIVSPNRFGVTGGANESLDLPALDKITWSDIGAKVPEVVPIDNWDRWRSHLPSADYAVITWTDAEWNALDFVFCDSQAAMPYYVWKNENSWEYKWDKYSLGFKEAKIDYHIPPEAPSYKADAWGSICMVNIDGKSVLLIKSGMHISKDGPDMPLLAFVRRIIDECSPKVLYTTGTAGGARVDSLLGNVSVTNAAKFHLTGEFAGKDYANKEFYCDWKPNGDIQSYVAPLVRPVAAANMGNFDVLISELNQKVGGSYTWNQLGNDNIDPDKIKSPEIIFWDKVPVLTTNGYEIATTGGNYSQYAAMEMDDAAVAMICHDHGQTFGILRNISDPVVNADLPTEPRDKNVQKDWSGDIYNTFGFYTSYNGALATWAAIKMET